MPPGRPAVVPRVAVLVHVEAVLSTGAEAAHLHPEHGGAGGVGLADLHPPLHGPRPRPLEPAHRLATLDARLIFFITICKHCIIYYLSCESCKSNQLTNITGSHSLHFIWHGLANSNVEKYIETQMLEEHHLNSNACLILSRQDLGFHCVL